MAVYTSRSNVKTHLGLGSGDSSLDALIDLVIEAVDGIIDGFTGRGSLASAQATEYYDGPGSGKLILRRRPVTAVAGVWVDAVGYHGQAAGAFGSGTEWTAGVDFVNPRTDATEGNGGMLVALRNPDFEGGGIWPRGIGNIKVTYTAGYATIPSDLATAATSLAVQLVQAAERGAPLSGETIGDYSYQLLNNPAGAGSAAPVLGAVASILARYRELHL